MGPIYHLQHVQSKLLKGKIPNYWFLTANRSIPSFKNPVKSLTLSPVVRVKYPDWEPLKGFLTDSKHVRLGIMQSVYII